MRRATERKRRQYGQDRPTRIARPKRALRVLRHNLGSAEALPTLPARLARYVPRRYTAA